MVNKARHIYSPLRYPGGKACIFPFISSLFYENDLIGINYAEPFAGGCGLALRLLQEEYINTLYINDLDLSIYAFWHEILNNVDEFCRWIEKVDVNVENWLLYRAMQTDAAKYSLFELAQSTFFLNRTNVSGIIKGGLIGGIDQAGKYKMDVRFNKIDLIERIKRIACFSSRIILTCQNGEEFIRSIDKRKNKTFIYLDPPYYQKGANLYMNFFNNDNHISLAKCVQKLNNLWLVSYDNAGFVKSLYAPSKKIVYHLSQCASNRVGTEVLIFDDRLKFRRSLSRLKKPIIEN